ncbi:PREDICTED: nucleolar pre-ribosomal-associated protein 1 [Ceratosolen solmsi marchali]|uniref:Nucleolar pre-ribosomal-associated protein 1 n=1 Tax=Ceratosolen solmsi marchali TaxID=326594 RepID=A0AAJ7DY21_9HYME|nr:PREDICTED: nucleolar pre-ribosomal-associated protein 1 [Ceratosolen solmsi marchali]
MTKKVSFNENLEICSESGSLEVGNDNIEMSINRKEKRKRKLDDVYVKPKKKGKSEEIESTMENDKNSSNVVDNEDLDDIVVSKEESDRFTGKFLRDSFSSSEDFLMLNKFVAICHQNGKRDLAAEFLRAGGTVLEILKSLDISEKKNINNTCVVFSAMHIVIMKILAKFPQNQSNAEEACRHLINTHLVSIHSMLSSHGKAKHRKIILKLLAAIVSLGGKLPRELLNHLSLHSQLVEMLVSHSKPTDRESVRTCFIYFILAFLIEGNATDIRALLEKRGVLSSIFSGLLYDYSDIVQLVLKTVKKYVLENPTITKTVKLHVFSTTVVQEIFNLYNWKGPKNWSSQAHKKQKFVTECIDAEDKEITVNCVHDFLITLLTSTRHGIAFHDRTLGTDSKYKHNQLISTLLQNLDKPWEHEKQSDLIIKILTVCPDLIKLQLIRTESYLVPRVSKKWIDTIHFISKIISNIDIESCLRFCSLDMTEIQFINAILNLILPSVVIKTAIIPSLEHSSFIIHHEIINLLLVMIKKVEHFVSIFESMKFSVSEISTYKGIISEHILKHIPNIDSIINLWTKTLSSNVEERNLEMQENVDFHVKDHLQTILNLLQAYCEICPEIFLTTSSPNIQKECIVLFTNFSNIEDLTTEELITMKVKTIKILLFSNILSFLPNEEIFNSALSFLITQIGNKDTSLDYEIRETINVLLEKSGIFEGYNDQIEIWIDGITYFKSLEKVEVANWITKIIKRVFKHNDKYASLIFEIERNSGEKVDINVQEKIFKELSERNFDDVKLVSSMLPVTSISLILYAAIENLNKKPSSIIERYISIVLTHLFHCQISTNSFINLVKELNIPMQRYFISWSNDALITPTSKPFKSNSIFQSINRLLLNSDQTYKVYSNEMQLYIEINENVLEYTPTNFEIKAAFRMIIFYLTQSLQKANTEINNTTVYTDTLLSLIKIAARKEMASTNLISYCAVLFVDICSLFYDLNKQSILSQFMKPYQDKFIVQLKHAINVEKASNLQKEVQAHLKLIQLLQLNIQVSIGLLATIMKLPKEHFVISNKIPKLSIWGIMIHKLIEQFFIEEVRMELRGSFPTINDNLLKKLFSYWIELKMTCKEDIELWESSIYTYLLKFPHSIASIDQKTFTAIIKTGITSKTIKILNLLTERNSKLIPTFINYANDNEDIISHKSLIFSILSSNLNYKWDKEFLKKICNIYNMDILNFLTGLKSNDYSWIMENVDAVSYLIDNSFEQKACDEVCETILSNGNQLDEIQEERIKLLANVFKKGLKIKPDSLKDFVQIVLHVTVTSLKRDSKNIGKLEFLCKTLNDSIGTLKLEDNFEFEELSKNYFWCQFIRISLKSGLKVTKENNNNNNNKAFLLKALVATCSVAYKDNGNEEYVKTIFDMTTSHSEFTNIMLSNANIKNDLTELLWILIRKNNTIMLIKHIPLYLASYNATLDTSDQFLLKILQHYENNGIKLDHYRPYLWSNAAAFQYSVKGEMDTALWRQPTTSQVLDILVPELVTSTIKNFPIKRDLKCNITNTICIGDQVYDPAFYLPVFTQLLADNNVIACHKVIHSGALALTIIACSSLCEDVRLAAFTVLSRFYFHLEATSSKEKLLWMNFIDSLRNGIFRNELALESIRLNGFLATFLARTSFIMTQPLNPLYSTLQSFLMAKSALDLNTIPELLQLYYSSEIDYQAHRHWILEVISDGLKSDLDMDVALRCVLFKMLFDFHSSTLSDIQSKNLILQIIRSATKLLKPCMILVNGYSLLPWLLTITQSLNKGDIGSTVCIIDIVNNILFAFDESKSKDTHHYLMLVKTLLYLMMSFGKNLTLECLKSFIDALRKAIINKAVCNAFTKDKMISVINSCKILLGNVDECESILQFGCKFVKKKNHINCNVDLSLQESLYQLITTWYGYLLGGAKYRGKSANDAKIILNLSQNGESHPLKKNGHPRGHASNSIATGHTDSVENYSIGTWKTGFLSQSDQNYLAHLALRTVSAQDQMEVLNDSKNFQVTTAIKAKDLDADTDELPKMQEWLNGNKIGDPYKIHELLIIMKHFYKKHNDEKHDVFVCTFYPKA